jgi:hypothetical protein
MVIIIAYPVAKQRIRRLSMNNITFIYDTKADICLLCEGKSIRELTIKGSCEYQGEVNGT